MKKGLLFALVLSLIIAPRVLAEEATPEATLDIPAEDMPVYALEWPLPAPTEEQIEEARHCDVEALSAERYGGLASDEIADAYRPETACDWATLAVAYGEQVTEDEELPEEGIDAYVQAVTLNPAMAYLLPILVSYFDQVDLVAPPEFAANPVVEIEIHYTYRGLGSSVDFTLTVTDADTAPTVTGELVENAGVTDDPSEPQEISGTLDVELVQSFAAALANLVPIETQFTEMVCFDNYPDWEVTLTFDDGTRVLLVTNGSNLLGAGGPWQTEIDGQNYMQHSTDLVQVAIAIREALGLPAGETLAMTCGGLQTAPIDDAFPPET